VNCRKCKKEIMDGSRFCSFCGTSQAEPSPSRRKRGNGQGCAIKRGKTWTAVWTEETYPDMKAKKAIQIRRWKGGFPTKTAALLYAASPEPDNADAPTLRTYWQGYQRSDYLDLSASKQSAARIAWKKMEVLAGKTMDELTIDQLQRCIDAKALTYYPAKDMKTLFSHLFKRAVAEGNARTNLADFIRLPELVEEEPEPFTETELRKIWDAYGAGEHFLGFVLLMIYSGMMPGELLTCKQDMIDWEGHEIRGCGLKTKKRKQTPIVFPEMISPVLEQLVENSESRKGYLVGMNKDNFYKEYHAAVQRAGVRDLPPYSCRHTTATALALGNIAPSVIQKVMRHTKFTTTQRYIHPDTASAHAAVNTLGKGEER